MCDNFEDYVQKKRFWMGVDLKIMAAAIAVAAAAYLLGWHWIVTISLVISWSSIASLTTQIFPNSHPYPRSYLTFPFAAVQLFIMWVSQLKYRKNSGDKK